MRPLLAQSAKVPFDTPLEVPSSQKRTKTSHFFLAKEESLSSAVRCVQSLGALSTCLHTGSDCESSSASVEGDHCQKDDQFTKDDDMMDPTGDKVNELDDMSPQDAVSLSVDPVGEFPTEPPRCDDMLQAILCHFSHCPVFMSNWSYSSMDSPVEQEQCLTQSVRHLCPRLCYMRAFAPYREWYALCQIVGQSYNEYPVGVLLYGWKCSLLRPSTGLEERDGGKYLPRTVFSNEAGIELQGKSRVLEHLRRHLEKSAMSISRPLGGLRLARSPQLIGSPLEEDVHSPFGLLEELFADDPWRLLLSTILLNRTSRVQVDSVMFHFLERWPSYEAVQTANVLDVVEVIRPLGICNRRAAGIIRFSREYHDLLVRKIHKHDADRVEDNLNEKKSSRAAERLRSEAFELSRDDVLGLYFCGSYAVAAYELFIRRNLDVETDDHALCMYVDYKRGVQLLREE